MSAKVRSTIDSSEEVTNVSSTLPPVDNSDFTSPDGVHAEKSDIISHSSDQQTVYSYGSNNNNSIDKIETNADPLKSNDELASTNQIQVEQTSKMESNNPSTGESGGRSTDSFISVKANSLANSIGDSKEKLVFFQGSTSNLSGNSISGELMNDFWKNIMLIVMTPYMLVGVPVIGILKLSQKHASLINTTTKDWFHFLFSTPLLMMINSIELLLVFLLNLSIIYQFVEPLYVLIRNSQMTERLISRSVHLYEIIPLIVGLNLVWPKGFAVSNIIRILDTKVERGSHERPISICINLVNMFASFLCLTILTVASVISFEWKLANFYLVETRFDFYYHLIARFFLMLLIPVYLVSVSGAHRRIKNLNCFVSTMANHVSAINLTDFQRVKNVFKENADVVCRINDAFNLLVSDILIIVLINIFKDLFQMFTLVASLDSISISLETGAKQTDAEMLSKAIKWIAVDAIVIMCKFALIWLTANKVKHTNRAIKRISIHLHELASQYVEKPSEIYQSFSLIKSYVKSRNEHSENPALLRLYAVKWIPCISIKAK